MPKYLENSWVLPPDGVSATISFTEQRKNIRTGPASPKFTKYTNLTVSSGIYSYRVSKVIEVSLRASLAHFHAATERYGPIGYYEKESFNTKHNHERFRESVNREIQHQQGSLIVQHYQKDYNGIFPLWVAMGFFYLWYACFFL